MPSFASFATILPTSAYLTQFFFVVTSLRRAWSVSAFVIEVVSPVT